MVGSFLGLEGLILLNLGDKRKVILRTVRSRMRKESPAVDNPSRVLYHQATDTRMKKRNGGDEHALPGEIP